MYCDLQPVPKQSEENRGGTGENGDGTPSSLSPLSLTLTSNPYPRIHLSRPFSSPLSQLSERLGKAMQAKKNIRVEPGRILWLTIGTS